MITLRQLIGRWWPTRRRADDELEVCRHCDGDGWRRRGLKLYRCAGGCHGSGLIRASQQCEGPTWDMIDPGDWEGGWEATHLLGAEAREVIVDELDEWRAEVDELDQRD